MILLLTNDVIRLERFVFGTAVHRVTVGARAPRALFLDGIRGGFAVSARVRVDSGQPRHLRVEPEGPGIGPGRRLDRGAVIFGAGFTFGVVRDFHTDTGTRSAGFQSRRNDPTRRRLTPEP